MSESAAAKIGILTVSDRVSRGEYDDRGGPAIRDYLEKVLISPWQAVVRVVADERQQIERALVSLCDDEGCSLVITTGGTGPAPRDVTPDATEAVCDRLLPGFGERMRAISAAHVPTSILARQIAGVRSKTLLVNLPGKPEAIAECLEAVFPAIPHAIELIGGPKLSADPGLGADVTHER